VLWVFISILSEARPSVDSDCSEFRSLKAKKRCREQQEAMQFWREDSKQEIRLAGDYSSEHDHHNNLSELDSPVSNTPTEPSFAQEEAEFGFALTTPTTPRQGPILYTVTPPPTTRDFMEEDLPECSTLDPDQIQEGDNCIVIEHVEPEVRWRDQILEKLLPQIWADYQQKIRYDKQLYGVPLEPYKVGNYSLSESQGVIEIFVEMTNVKIHGLSTIYIDETLVTRSESLNDLQMKMVFKFEELLVNGSYTAEGSAGFWSKIDSEGVQQFFVLLENATVSPSVRLDVSDIFRFGCGGEAGSVLLTELEVPITYSDISINFNNLGAFYNSILNIGINILLKTQEKNVVAMVKDKIKEELNSLLC